MSVKKLAGVAGLFLTVAMSQGPEALTVQGLRGKTVALPMADLSNLPQQTVKASDQEYSHG